MSFRDTMRELNRLAEKERLAVSARVYELRYIRLVSSLGEYTGEIWVYAGVERDYLLVPGIYCSCKDFTMRTLINKTSRYCKHLAGLHMAISEGKYRVLHATPEEAIQIVMEILEKGFSLTLRRKILEKK